MRKPCCDKKLNVQGAWSAHEDQKLKDYIHKHGQGRWQTLAKAAGLQRCGKSCRLRWMNYLKPGIKKGNFGEDEDDLIIKLHALLGNRWSLIAGRLPGRTDNEVKNYWNTHLSRKLKKQELTNIESKPFSAGFQHTSTTSNHSDECCSSLSSCSDNQQYKRPTFNSTLSSDDTDRCPDELPDLNIGLTTTSCDGEEINELFTA